MKNRYLLLPLFLIGLLFFIPSIVKANTYSYSILDSNFDLINDTFLSCKSLSDDYFSSHIEYDRYVMVYRSTIYYTLFVKSDSSSSTSKVRYYANYLQWQLTTTTTDTFMCFPQNEPPQQFYQSNTSTTSPITANISARNGSVYFSELVYYTSRNNSIPLLRFSNTDVFNFTINNESIVVVDNNNPNFPSLYDIYLTLHPLPDDNYPILTSFFTTFINRLSYLCEYISSSYIFLSMFVILILYLTILLLRRLI